MRISYLYPGAVVSPEKVLANPIIFDHVSQAYTDVISPRSAKKVTNGILKRSFDALHMYAKMTTDTTHSSATYCRAPSAHTLPSFSQDFYRRHRL